jgi:outer membrane protein OmpA-like peptidoglycan-associated protein/tetratricopeptide (TPR) repeat protein
MKYLYLILIIFFLSTCTLTAQMNVTISNKEFKTGKPGFNEAWKLIRKGNSYYKKGGVWYSYALKEYMQACDYNNNNAELLYKIGVSYLFSDKKDKASEYIIKALQLKSNVAPDILFLAGRSLQYAGKYMEAIDKYKSFLSSGIKKSDKHTAFANKCIDDCNSALAILKDTIRLEIKNIGTNINSQADEYSEVISGDGKKLYFASRRALTSTATNYYEDTKFDENIFISDWADGSWSPAVLAAKNLTTSFCETPLYIDPAGDQLYIYAGYVGNGDIKVSKYKKGEWSTPEPERFGINSKASETSFCVSPSGEEIAFVSNRKKGLGGKDIYFIRKINNRKWSRPLNAGPNINTQYDEESVRYSKGGDTLWFSSTGHNTMGGFDIFYCKRDSSGNWAKAVNAGYPLNTTWDELFYVPSPVSDSSFYFVSNRSGGFGGFDIYTGRIPPPPPPQPIITHPVISVTRDTVVIKDTVVIIKKESVSESVAYLIGKVSDSETGDPVMARIEIVDLSTDAVIGTFASSEVDGSFKIMLPSKKSYMVDFRAPGFLSEMKRTNVTGTYPEEYYTLNVPLTKVKVGKKVVLNNILFQLGKSVLTAGSYTELNRLVIILQDNPKMKIEISGHTDITGSPVINAKLSSDRAKAVVDWLTQKGIDRTRLTYKGYGSDQPIADNKTEEGRSKNRRVEFKILEF